MLSLYPPQRARKPRQPPACALGVPICSTNSSLGASSSMPGSSGARTIGITAGSARGRSWRGRRGCGTGARARRPAIRPTMSAPRGLRPPARADVRRCRRRRHRPGSAGLRGLASAASCPARPAAQVASVSPSRGGSARPSLGRDLAARRGRGQHRFLERRGLDGRALVRDGRLATGVCHWNASIRPVTGDTGRQRSLT